MTPTTLSKPISSSIADQDRPLAEHRVILHNVSWHTFESLLADLGDRRKTLFHYFNSTLEIMSPLSLHEGSSRFFDRLLTVFVDELEIDMRCLGSLGNVSHLLNQVIDKNGKPIPAFFIVYACYFLLNKCETLPINRLVHNHLSQ